MLWSVSTVVRQEKKMKTDPKELQSQVGRHEVYELFTKSTRQWRVTES